jgi:hypothetical protein
MNIQSVKINCYIEGVRIPINSCSINYARNDIAQATLRIPVGGIIKPIMWANALVQITYQKQLKETLFFQGLITNLSVIDEENILQLLATSAWSTFNLNSTFDYVAPKKYGITNVEDEITIFLGNEQEIKTVNDIGNNAYHLSQRYFFLEEQNQERGTVLEDDSTEKYKLQFIIDRTPFASLIAFNLFEQIAYDNFYLSRAYIDRLNLLTKISPTSNRTGFDVLSKQTELDAGVLTLLDEGRSGLAYKVASTNKVTAEQKTEIGSLNLSSLPLNLPFKPISEKGKRKLETSSYVKQENNVYGYKDKTGFVTVEQIIQAYNTYCKEMNVDANLLLAQSYHESAGFNPYARSSTGASGWSQFVSGTWIEQTGLSLDDRFSILASIKAQCKYMHFCFSKANGDWKQGLSNYVDGPNASNRPQTPAYIASISGIYSGFF